MKTTMFEYYGIGKKPGQLKQQSHQNKTWEKNSPKDKDVIFYHKDRFLNSRKIANLKKHEAIINSQIKRGEIKYDSRLFLAARMVCDKGGMVLFY